MCCEYAGACRVFRFFRSGSCFLFCFSFFFFCFSFFFSVFCSFFFSRRCSFSVWVFATATLAGNGFTERASVFWREHFGLVLRWTLLIYVVYAHSLHFFTLFFYVCAFVFTFELHRGTRKHVTACSFSDTPLPLPINTQLPRPDSASSAYRTQRPCSVVGTLFSSCTTARALAQPRYMPLYG